MTNLKQNRANFLGFSIYTYRNQKLTRKDSRIIRTAGYDILVSMDMKRVLNHLTTKGFCQLQNVHRPIAKPSLSVLTIQEMITNYNYMIRGISNYYLPKISRAKDLIRTIYILEYSCYMTLAKKYSTKITKIRQKYGKPLIVEISELQTGKNIEPRYVTKKYELLTYLTVKKLVLDSLERAKKKDEELLIPDPDFFNPLNKINWRTLRNLDAICCICGTSENVEMHHIHAIRKGKVTGFSQVMKQLNRKTIPLCKQHHIAAEKGLLSDIKKEDLYNLKNFLA